MTPAFNPSTACLFLDFDGTLADIAPRPEEVVVPPDLKEHLQCLSERLSGAVALVSGRPISVLDDFLNPLILKAAGAHGAELRFSSQEKTSIATVAALLPKDLTQQIVALSQATPGTSIEDKGVSLAVHYRFAPEKGPALLQAMKQAVAEFHVPHLTVLPGHFVFEIKHTTHNKGTAIEAFMLREPFIGRQPVFIGDDVTDEAGFAVLSRYSGSGYSVGREAAHAMRAFETPSDVRAWIAGLASPHSSLGSLFP